MGRILIVDDHFANRQLLVEILNSSFQCDEAAMGRAALDIFSKALEVDPYDVVILDIAMPEVSGLDVLKGIREMEKQKNIPAERSVRVLMCSAFKEPFIEAFKCGCDDYIMKPIDAVSLTVMVTRHVQAFKKGGA